MSNFDSFKTRLAELRERADEFADKDEINKSLDTVEKAWVDAAKANKLAESEQVKSALRSTQYSSDILAYNILFCDTSETTSDQILKSIVKFQALEQIRGAFAPTAAIALEEAVEAGIEAEKLSQE